VRERESKKGREIPSLGEVLSEIKEESRRERVTGVLSLGREVESEIVRLDIDNK
jgi:hypothetical protein